jgi:hypothetical protein
MSKPIALPAVLALALCGAAQGQSITWVEEGGKTGGSLKLPRLASDYIESFLVVGNQQSTGPLGYLTGTTYDCIFAYAICWGSAGHDDKGANPSVALTVMTDAQNTKLDTAVEVHEGTSASLFFHTGTNLYPLLGTVDWNSSTQYDSGYKPSVSIDPFPLDHLPGFTATVVEVHQACPSLNCGSGTGASALWYHVGTLSMSSTGTPSLSWGPAYKFDAGVNPSVSVCNGLAVEVHQGDPGTLWYSMGTVSGNTISWGSSVKYDSGYMPSVSLCGGGEFGIPYYLVEVHQATSPATGDNTALWYHVSQYTPSSVTWRPATKYATGCSPTASIFNSGSTSTGMVAETHTGVCGEASTVYYDLGDLVL